MPAIARDDSSIFGRWWWTVDRWTLLGFAVLAAFGIMFIAAASPPVAERIGLDPQHFLRRQAMVLGPAALILFMVSMLPVQRIRRLAVAAFAGSIGLLILTLFFGPEIKGAHRWLPIAGFSLQPSEFVKPAFAVVAAWVFAARRLGADIPGYWIAAGLYVVVVTLLLLQPDVGQIIVVTVVWFAQWFLVGLPMVWVCLFAIVGLGASIAAYLLFDHVASRIDRFLNPAVGDNYQAERAMDAFLNGGLFGRGPGHGTVKTSIPDAHADFILAVAGEEFGLIACLFIVSVFAAIVLRGFSRILQETDLFVVLAVTGLLVQFGLQALINMASTLSLMPTKGMTLPFISYGGSSLLALAFGMGMLLALTRKRAGGQE
ncbi:MAG: cell division protein FtsW [Alphaproteobacteria bacterium]|jgi:cell division protein FtsW